MQRDYNWPQFLEDLRTAIAPWQRVGREPARQDKPNAPMPAVGDAAPPQDQFREASGAARLDHCHGSDCVHFRAASELHGKRLHNVRGTGPLHGARVPADGLCHAHRDDHELCSHLAAAGFQRLRSHAVEKDETLDSIKQVLRGGALKAAVMTGLRKGDPTGAAANAVGGDLMQWLGARAETAAKAPASRSSNVRSAAMTRTGRPTRLASASSDADILETQLIPRPR